MQYGEIRILYPFFGVKNVVEGRKRFLLEDISYAFVSFAFYRVPHCRISGCFFGNNHSEMGGGWLFFLLDLCHTESEVGRRENLSPLNNEREVFFLNPILPGKHF